MSEALHSPVLIVIYANDIERVAAFYSRTLARPVVSRDAGFIVVGDTSMEVAVVRMSAETAAEVANQPVAVREDTAVKPSFLVDDLASVREAATESGGALKPLDSAWEWRGQLHLDAHDPEGNVVQFRQVVPRADNSSLPSLQ